MSEHARGGALARLGAAWRTLTPDGRLAAAASFALFVTMLLPWYQQNAVLTSGKGEPLVSQDLTAFGVFSFVEAAVLLVAVAVLVLLFVRAEGATFHLPGGDGATLLGAGLWVVLLLVWRLFDKPGITTRGAAANVGVQWGIFFALAAAGTLAWAGSRMRRAERPPPPATERRRRPRAPAPEAPPGTTLTQVLPPEQPLRRRARPPAPEDQLTMPLAGEPPLGDDER